MSAPKKLIPATEAQALLGMTCPRALRRLCIHHGIFSIGPEHKYWKQEILSLKTHLQSELRSYQKLLLTEGSLVGLLSFPPGVAGIVFRPLLTNQGPVFIHADDKALGRVLPGGLERYVARTGLPSGVVYLTITAEHPEDGLYYKEIR